MILVLMLLGAGQMPAAPENQAARVAFVFRGVDQKSGVAVLAPLVAPAIGVQLDSGPRKIERGEVLHCRPEMRTHAAIIEGEPATVSEQILCCGDGDEQRVLVVKGIIFAKGNG